MESKVPDRSSLCKWSPQTIGALCIVEGVQRRATKFILGYPEADLSYKDRLSKLNLLPISYWHKIRDLVFFIARNHGHFETALFVSGISYYTNTKNKIKNAE